MGPLGALLQYILIVVVILGLAYWVTRYMGTRGGPGIIRQSGQNLQMKILAQITVGRDQRLVVADIAGRYFLLGLSSGGISNLAELTREDIEAWQARENRGDEPRQSNKFAEVLAQIETRRKQR